MAAAAAPMKKDLGGFVQPNYEDDLQNCSRFLSEFRSMDDTMEDAMAEPKYKQQLQAIANRDAETLTIQLDDVQQVRSVFFLDDSN